MEKDASKERGVQLGTVSGDAKLAVRLRILWHLWKTESIDSRVFPNSHDILFGIQLMLKHQLYAEKIIAELEEQTLAYLFADRSRLLHCKPHQKRYLLLQRLSSFLGTYIGLSFAAKFGYVEHATSLSFAESKELALIEESLLNLGDFLAQMSIYELKNLDFQGLTRIN